MAMPSTKRLLLVGCGGMGRFYLDLLPQIPGLQLVGLVDNDPAKANDERIAAASKPFFTTVAEAVAVLRPDVVINASPPDAHAQTTMAALLGGAHVLCEKPFAPNAADAREMISAARAANRHLAVMQNRRFHPGVRALRQLIAQGTIGTLDMVCADFFIPLAHGGFREAMAHILLEDMAIHTFDAARYMTQVNALNVWADSWSASHSWFPGGGSCVAHFQMQHGIRFTYRGSWTPLGCATSWEAQWRILGSRGTLLWDGHQQILLETAPDAKIGERAPAASPQPVAPPPVEEHGGGFLACLREFLHAIDTDTRAETDARDNAHSLAMVLASLDSINHRRLANVEVIDA